MRNIDPKIIELARNHSDMCIRERLVFAKAREIQARPKEEKKRAPSEVRIDVSESQLKALDKALKKM